MASEFLQRVFELLFIESADLPEPYKIAIIFGVYAFLITLYAIVVWKFYHFLGRRDIIQLDLQKYNTSEHPFLSRFLGLLLYVLEYIIVMPLLVLFWFAILAFFLLVMSGDRSVEHVLLISGAIIASVRLTSYISQGLSKELAKLFPFTVLVVFFLDPRLFSLENFVQKMNEIPAFFEHIVIYLVMIAGLEMLIRVSSFVILFFIEDEGGERVDSIA